MMIRRSIAEAISRLYLLAVLLWMPGHPILPHGLEAAAPADPAAAITLSGRVVAAVGDRPIAGATVRLLPSGLSAADPERDPEQWSDPTLARTHEDGTFAVRGIEGERFNVRVEAKGYTPFNAADVGARSDLSVRLQAGHELRGRVLGQQDQQPLAGARVTACDDQALTFGEEACPAAATDDQGYFQLESVPAGELVVEAVASAHARSEPRRVQAPLTSQDRGPAPLVFHLRAGGRLSGRVMGPQHKPVAQARLLLVPQEGRVEDQRAEDHLPLFSRADGSFAFEGIPAGTSFKVRAQRRGWPAVDAGPFTIDPGTIIGDVVIELREAALLSLRLVDPEGQPLDGGIDLMLRKPSQGEPTLFSARGQTVAEEWITSKKDGRYVAGNLRAGRYDVVIRPHGWAGVERRDVSLAAGETRDLGTIVARKGRTVSGTVSDAAGVPIAGARVEALHAIEHGGSSSLAETDTSGAYELAGLGEDPLTRVRVSAKGYADAVRRGVTPGESDVDFTLEPTGAISGSVVLENGEPVPQFEVKVHPEASEEPEARSHSPGRVGPKRFLDKSGEFRLEELAPGSYTLEVHAAGKAPGRNTGITVTSGELTAAGRIVLQAGATLRGRVLAGERGSPVEGARVHAKGRDFESRMMNTHAPQQQGVLTGADGAFTLEGLAVGSATIRAQHPDYAPVEARVELAPDRELDELVLQLKAGGTIAGTVRDAQGQPAAGARIMVMPAAMNILDAAQSVTGADGRYQIPRLAPGSYRVARLPPADDPNPMNVIAKMAEVREDEVTIVDLEESARINLHGEVRRGSHAIANAQLFFVAGDGESIDFNFKLAQADAAGRYQVGLDRPGAYQVMVQSAGSFPPMGGAALSINVPDQPQVSLDLVLQEGGVRGTVTDMDGRPLTGASVMAHVAGAGEGVEARHMALTGAGGSYRIEGLEPGSYDLVAAAQGFQVGRRPAIVVSEQQPGPVVDFELARGRTVRGRLIDSQEQGIPHAFVFISAAGAPSLATPSQTDINGAFRSAAPAEGALDITAVAAGWAPARLSGVVPAENADAPELILQASTGGRLRIQVRSVDGKPLSGVRLSVKASPPFAGSDMMWVLSPAPPTDAQGESLVELLAPGVYKISSTGAPGAGQVQAVVQEGVETAVLLRVP